MQPAHWTICYIYINQLKPVQRRTYIHGGFLLYSSCIFVQKILVSHIMCWPYYKRNLYCMNPLLLYNCSQFSVAAAGQDYTGGSYMTTFEVRETAASVSIPIIKDTISEMMENFSAVLTIPAAAASLGIIKGAADTATIDILDNDPVEVVFNLVQYSVDEGDSVVTLTLNADKAASFAYTVEVLTQDGTATGNVEMLLHLNASCFTLQKGH